MLTELKLYCRNNKTSTIAIICAILAGLIRLYIAVHTPMTANMLQEMDDAYFVNIASSIAQGDWLGEYNGSLLQKVPGYAFFLVLPLASGLSYQLILALLEIFAAIVLLAALKPFKMGAIASCVIFVLLIFSPDLFTWAFFQRTYRMGILIPFVEILFASYIAMWLRPNDAHIAPWIVLTSLTMPVMFLVKEDSIWIMPFAIGASLGIAIKRAIGQNKGCSKKNRSRQIIKVICALLAPFIISFACLNILSVVNYLHYGVYSYSDRYDSSLSDVCADLVHIQPNEDVPENIWVSDDAIEQAYEASPTLASISQELDDARRLWASLSPTDEPIIDHSFWALKTATESPSSLRSASEKEQFYSKVHKELSEAFSEGTLTAKSGLSISSTVEPIPWTALPGQITSSIKRTLHFYMGDELPQCSRPSGVSDGEEQMQRKASVLLNGPVVFSNPDDPERRVGAIFQGISHGWVLLCSNLMPFLFAAYVIMVLVLLYLMLFRRNSEALPVFIAWLGITLTQFLLVFCVSWFCSGLGDTARWATSMYCAPFYPLYEISFVLLLAFLINAFIGKKTLDAKAKAENIALEDNVV